MNCIAQIQLQSISLLWYLLVPMGAFEFFQTTVTKLCKSEPFRKLRLPKAKLCNLSYEKKCIYKHYVILWPELTVQVGKKRKQFF